MSSSYAFAPDDENQIIEEMPDPQSVPVERLADEVTIPGCPISAPLTWAQIRERYPDEWVCVVEIEHCAGASPAFRCARVIGHGQGPRDPYVQADPWQKHYRSIGHYFTGVVDGSPFIVVDARVWGPSGDRPLRLAVATGATETTIAAHVIDRLGYSPRHGDAIMPVRPAVGEERGYILRVTRFAALGFMVPDFRVRVLDLPEGRGVDGLVGLNFLRWFNYEVRSAEGMIRIERIAA